MSHFLFRCILGVSIFNTIQAQLSIIPYPFYNREYAVPFSKKIETNSFNQHYGTRENSWEMLLNAVYFCRTADRSYTQIGKNRGLAAAIHGSDNFEVSDGNRQSEEIILNSNTHYFPLLKDYEYLKYEAKIQPNYEYNESGGVLAFDLIRKIDEEKKFLLQLRLPIISQSIIHKNPQNTISNSSRIIQDSRAYLDDQNQYFQARLDFLQERGLVKDERSPLTNLKGLSIQKEISENYFANKTLEQEELHEYGELLYHLPDQYEFKSENKNNIYASTKFNRYAEPTEESQEFYHAIKNTEKKITESEFNAILQGHYFGKNYRWESFQNNHFAPLDIQLNFTKIIDTVIIQGLLSAALPIEKREKSENFLEIGIFSPQPAVRIGTQINYGFTNNYCLVGYISLQYNLPTIQTIPALFSNQSAYGFSPLYLEGKVSWFDLYCAAHLRIERTENYGATIGYQYLYKSGDTIIPEVDCFYLLNGEKELLNYESWKNLSQSSAQLIVLNGYCLYRALQLQLELRTVFHGKNIPEIKELSLRCGLDF